MGGATLHEGEIQADRLRGGHSCGFGIPNLSNRAVDRIYELGSRNLSLEILTFHFGGMIGCDGEVRFLSRISFFFGCV